MRKKIFSVLLILLLTCMLFVLAGCGKDKDDKDNNQNTSETENKKTEENVTREVIDDNDEEDLLEVGEYTLKYGSYIGKASSGGYELTESCEITKDKITIENETFEYVVSGDSIVGKNADTITLKVTSDNEFTDASGIYKFTYNDVNNNSSSELDTNKVRYVWSSNSLGIQIDLYDDNRVVYEYIPRTGNLLENYGTYTIDGNKLIITFNELDSFADEKDWAEPLEYTIVSSREFKDKDGNVYKGTSLNN